MSKNTVTNEQIENIIAHSKMEVFHRVHDKQCLVVAKLPNGFTVVGESACVDPNNYDEQIGFDLAVKHIKNRLWELEGYALQNKLHHGNLAEGGHQAKLHKSETVISATQAQTLKEGVVSFSESLSLQQGHVRLTTSTYVGETSHDTSIEGAVDDVLTVWDAIE